SLAGLPTTFVRLAACNLRCSWCDTTYSFGKGESTSLEKIYAQVDGRGLKYVCITGGEPLLQQNVYELMTTLCDKGYTLSLETSGSLSTAKVDFRVRTILDIKCPDSGMSDKNYWQNLPNLRPHDEVKFVVAGKDDYNYAKEICKRYKLFDRKNPVLFSPV